MLILLPFALLPPHGIRAAGPASAHLDHQMDVGK
jgi:hypothetical protein